MISPQTTSQAQPLFETRTIDSSYTEQNVVTTGTIAIPLSNSNADQTSSRDREPTANQRPSHLLPHTPHSLPPTMHLQLRAPAGPVCSDTTIGAFCIASLLLMGILTGGLIVFFWMRRKLKAAGLAAETETDMGPAAAGVFLIG
ncbi:hypothetical protein OHC33_010032 [Knufia fluminis]|uniref:Uncharacterized protein n=1 Tax=Knufia fluminis TaxID=191047 RepID=A0AAN8EKL1_9EURO|nr:hypothetical protein OHC33_010032 [Knufia fluminis]